MNCFVYGGDRAPRFSEYNNPELAREKIRQKSLGRIVSNDTKIKMSLAHRGKMNAV